MFSLTSQLPFLYDFLLANPGQSFKKKKFLVDKIMQGLRIIFFPTILILRYFYPHQLIGIFPESFFMNARPEAERLISTFNFPFLFFWVREGLLLIMVPFSVCHVLFARVLLSSPALLSCPFSCCALVSLLLLCVHRPLLSLLNSHAPSSSARHRRAQLITPLLARSLWRTPHRFIDFSLCGLTGSFCRLPRPIAPTN